MTDSCTLNPEALRNFFSEQLRIWPDARARYEALKQVETRIVNVCGYPVILQHNPARAVSTGAKIDASSIRKRACFLCPSARPAEQMVFNAVPGFDILVNPFPIFPEHFTIVCKEHIPQNLAELSTAADIAMKLPGYVVFYNGAKSGASAPDHLHFQAGNSDFLPIISDLEQTPGEVVAVDGGTAVYSPAFLPMSALHIVTDAGLERAARWLDMIVPDNADGLPDGDMRNIIFWKGADSKLHILHLPRRAHRPSCYFDEERNLMVSPGAVDMCGVLILPRKADFENITRADIIQIFDEVSFRFQESTRFKNLLLT